MYEELVKELRDLLRAYKATDNGNCHQAQIIEEAADAIEDLIKALTASNEVISKSKPRWIPVTERLPEKEDEAVIVWKKQGFALIDWRHDNKWAILDNNCGIATHWMPLPEAPKEEHTDV